METPGNLVLVLVMLLNFYLVSASRLNAVIKATALQGILLGLMPLLIPHHFTTGAVAIAIVTVMLKGIAIPTLLFRAMREASIKREIEPLMGFIASMVFLAIGTALCVALTSALPFVEAHEASLLAPVSFSTILTGFILLSTRRKAITQIIGFLTLENGIFVFGLLLVEVMPFLVEMGVLLDLFVAIFVMGIIVNQIQRTFSSLDTFKLSSLKE